MRVYVLVNSEPEYADWCVLNHVNPLAARCVVNPHELRGKLRPGDRLIDARPAPLMCQPGRMFQQAFLSH